MGKLAGSEFMRHKPPIIHGHWPLEPEVLRQKGGGTLAMSRKGGRQKGGAMLAMYSCCSAIDDSVCAQVRIHVMHLPLLRSYCRSLQCSYHTIVDSAHAWLAMYSYCSASVASAVADAIATREDVA